MSAAAGAWVAARQELSGRGEHLRRPPSRTALRSWRTVTGPRSPCERIGGRRPRSPRPSPAARGPERRDVAAHAPKQDTTPAGSCRRSHRWRGGPVLAVRWRPPRRARCELFVFWALHLDLQPVCAARRRRVIAGLARRALRRARMGRGQADVDDPVLLEMGDLAVYHQAGLSPNLDLVSSTPRS